MTENSLMERKVDHGLADSMPVGKGINFETAGQLMEFAKMMAASGSAVPKHLRGQPGSCLGVLDDAVRFGINPYALARQSYFVNDQLAYMAAVFMAVINARAPLKTRPDIRFEGDGNEMRATVTGTFRDGAVREYKSPRVADIQPKNSPLWKSDPAQQLSYYSLRSFARRWCPEVILGIHDVDELREAAMMDITPKAEPAKSIPRSLDEFVAATETMLDSEISTQGDTSSAAGSGGAQVGEPAPHASPSEEAAAAAGSVSQLPTDETTIDNRHTDIDRLAEMKTHAISVVLKGATNVSIPVDRRIANLDEVYGAFEELDAGFLKQLVQIAGKVARGELKGDAGKKYLESLR